MNTCVAKTIRVACCHLLLRNRGLSDGTLVIGVGYKMTELEYSAVSNITNIKDGLYNSSGLNPLPTQSIQLLLVGRFPWQLRSLSATACESPVAAHLHNAYCRVKYLPSRILCIPSIIKHVNY